MPNDVEHGRSSGNQEPSPHRHTFLRFSDDSTTFAVAVQSASDMNRLLVQINYAFMTSSHLRCSLIYSSSESLSNRLKVDEFVSRYTGYKPNNVCPTMYVRDFVRQGFNGVPEGATVTDTDRAATPSFIIEERFTEYTETVWSMN